jgi:L-cystine uptake protein TcyP (sodium:dicarboxylate symporter family)
VDNKKLTGFGRIIVISLVFFTIANIILLFTIQEVYTISDNQLLYLFSTEAQVIGSLFGLMLTAFIFFIDKFKGEPEENETLVYDAIKHLKKKYYNNLKCIAIVITISILFCFWGILLLKRQCVFLLSFVVCESLISGCIGLFSIIIFAITLINPEKKEKEMKRIEYIVSEQIKPNSDGLEGSLEDFILPYNRIEKICSDWASYCVGKNTLLESYRGKIFPAMTYNLRILNKSELLDSDLLNELDKLRVYRNAIVHSAEEMRISKPM